MMTESEQPAEEAPEPRLNFVSFLRYTMGLLRPYWGRCMVIVLSMLIQAVFFLAQPISFQYILDQVIPQQDYRLLFLILGGLGAGFVLVMVFELISGYIAAGLGARILNTLRLQMFDHLQRLSMRFYGRSQVSDIMARFTIDLGALDRAVSVTLFQFYSQFMLSITSLGLLFFIEWRLALVTLITFPLSSVGPKLFGAKAGQLSSKRKEQEAEATGVVQENIATQKAVQILDLHGVYRSMFRTKLDQLFDITVGANLYSGLVEKTSGMSLLLSSLIVTGVGAYLCMAGFLTLGGFIAFMMVMGNVARGAMAITRLVPDLINASAGAGRIVDLLDEVPEITDAPDAIAMPVFSKEIRFEGVSFGYTDDALTLKDVHLTIQAKKSAAFVGRSGSGKSTILNLMTRFYDAGQGQIAIDGHNIKQLTRTSLHHQIGVVFQDIMLFNTTVRENIRMGLLDATDDAIEQAAKAAEMHDLILSLPQGYDTEIGEGGGRLSGGQRQRLVLARALLRAPSILILDEATSALDPATEAAVNETLQHLARDRTIISITHRLASVVEMDSIFVLDDGRVVEQGSHEELLAQNGLYKEMWDKQSGFTLSEDGGHAEVEVERLRSLPILEKLDDRLLSEIAELFVTEQYTEDRAVIQQGDPGDRFYIIVRGRVAVSQTDDMGNERLLGVQEVGDHFGEIALLANVPRTATVRTLTPCILLTLQRQPFAYLLEQSPQVREMLEQDYQERISR
ncbi:MAG: ABC transporter transmembrane domain-containing protein [bacterium]|nr:ABC transporter transmembrane domain-containing protein [bacterium]